MAYASVTEQRFLRGRRYRFLTKAFLKEVGAAAPSPALPAEALSAAVEGAEAVPSVRGGGAAVLPEAFW